MNLKRGVAGAVSSMTLYAITGFGIVFAIMSSGLDLNSFSLLAGALGVGIGFGLQDIVRNFISGIILIFERPVQIGDAVEVEELSGVIRKIGIRSSVIKTWEGAEVIVPNGNLISNKLINWTFSDHQKRLEIKVGVAYGSDVQKVIKLLHDCTKGNEEILLNPAPSVFFKDFADSALLFELRCWTENFNSWLQIQSDLRVEIEKVLRENGIEIPFPQTDVHIKSGDLIPAKKTK
ncbi:MAG: mechanosensitive ion channel [Ignavibacteriales bacterium]|nr:mechanosensitive ion channel [Ignavibacteriales bacterium]